MTSTTRRIGISGGTFDPIHHGHLIVAQVVMEKLKLDHVVFIPSGTPPHKQSYEVTDAELRFRMLELAISGNPDFTPSRIEIDRKGMTYTVDTLTELKALYGEKAELIFIIGADVVADLLTWKDSRKVFEMCGFAAVMRPGYDSKRFDERIALLEKNYGAVIYPVEAPLIDISSTAIRKRVSEGKSIRYLVPETVNKFIHDNRLYCSD